MKRWIAPDRPSDFPARLTLYLGWASFLPPFTPLTALLAAAAGILSHTLCTRNPERYTGKPKAYLGLALALVALALFLGEAALFLSWKQRQAYGQRLTVSRFRMDEISQALERYREEKGAYPEAPTLQALKQTLEPFYLAEVPVKDGFGRDLVGESRAGGFTLRCFPPPPKEGAEAPLPIEVHSAFQPAPVPPPPPLPDVNALDVNAPTVESPGAPTAGADPETGPEAPSPGAGTDVPPPLPANTVSSPATPPTPP